MVVLALLPGPGILVVVARVLSGGMPHGIATSAGIVAGDYVFIILSVFGLAALASTMGQLFVWIQYLGGLYLIWLGLSLLKKPANRQDKYHQAQQNRSLKLGADFLAGLVTTLSNPKAILFYLSFFPAFLDLTQVKLPDLVIILIITTFAVGGTMLGYAWLALKAHATLDPRSDRPWLRWLSSVLLLGSGVFLMLRDRLV